MAYNAFRGMKPLPQLLFTAFIAMSVFIVFQVITSVVAIPLFGFDRVSGMLGGPDLTDAGNISMLKFFQISQSVSLFVIPSLVAVWLMYESPWKSLHLERSIRLVPAMMVLLLIVMVNPFINFLGGINSAMHFPEWLSGVEDWMRNAEETAGTLTDAFLKADGIGGLLFNLFMIAVLPALGEELLFRGVIQRILSDLTRNIHWGIWLSAALFSALHLQFFGFIPRMVLGAMFGYLLVWSGSLWLPILAHFLNNAMAVIALYLIDKGSISPAVEEFGNGPEYWYYALPSLFFGILVMWTIRHQYKNQL